MAEIKIKTTSSGTTVPPSTLEARTLGMHQDQLYYGDSNNTPTRILSTKDISFDGTTATLIITKL